MKTSTTLALTALFALAAAVPLEKRDTVYTTTVIENVIETVDVLTTVWVQPGDPRLTQNQQVAVPSSATSPTVQASPTSKASVYVEEQNQKAKAQVQTPPPTSTPAAIPSSTPAPASSSTPAVVAQPELKTAAPVQNTPIPVTNSATPSGPSGGACGQVNGKCTAENVTTFGGGLGACGFDDATFTHNYFALAHEMMGEASNSNPNCNRTATISYNGQTFKGTLQDKCMGCGGASLDLSPELFNAMFPTAGGTGNFHDIEWWFTS